MTRAPENRYRKLLESYQRLLRQQLAFGFHVHVGLEDREATPGYPTQVWGRLPTAGPPAPFPSLTEHDALVRALVEIGSVLDAASVYWDVRLPEKLDTVEVRVAEAACSRVDEAVMLAGLYRALVRPCRERAERGESYASVRPELLRAAHWHASRHGLDADLVEAQFGRAVAAREVIEKVLAFARPALEEDGDSGEVAALVRETLEHGNAASRQRRAYERAGRLEDVVDTLIEETAPGGQVRQDRE